MALEQEAVERYAELADQMVLTSGGATRLVDRLVKAGSVERVACPADRPDTLGCIIRRVLVFFRLRPSYLLGYR